jgi:hypothetical protein
MDYFLTPRNAIDDVPIPFVWNMNEIRHFHLTDAHPETVYIPTNFTTDPVPVPMNRPRTRITLVGYTYFDGSFMKFMIVI